MPRCSNLVFLPQRGSIDRLFVLVLMQLFTSLHSCCVLSMQEFMSEHDFKSIEDFRGASLPYFTSHMELVRMQRENKAKRRGLANDAEWSGDGFVKESESMVAN